MPIKLTNIGANLTVRAGTPVLVTAGGGADNVEQTGPWVNRNPLLDTGLPALSPRIQGPYESAVLAFVLDMNLAAAVTANFNFRIQTAVDGSGTGAADYGTAFPVTLVGTGPGGGGRITTVVRTNVDFNLSTANAFVGYKFTMNLSSASVDTAQVTPIWIFGGSDVIPVV